MSDGRSTARDDQRFMLSARPPLRALTVASFAAVFGTLILVFWGVRDRGALLLAVGAASLVFGVALAAVAYLRNARLRTVVLLDAEAITVIQGRRRRRLPWSSLNGATSEGPRLTLHADGHRRGVAVVNTQSSADPVFVSLVAAVRARVSSSGSHGGAV